MKKYLVILLFAFLALGLSAHTRQSGIVREYNEKDIQTPLPGVELRVSEAGSTVSEKDGSFLLEFLTLRPGQYVNVRSIEKDGYEIFNKEAIEQWNINPDRPFIVIMCRSDKLKKIRDSYESKASANYKRQYDKEVAELARLKSEGRIKEEEYARSLERIQSVYMRQLEDLGNYVDRFSRIDLSELSAGEQAIIELVRQGRVEEAAERYDALMISERMKKEIAERDEIRSAIARLREIEGAKVHMIDSLYAMKERQVNTLRLQSGVEINEEVASIYREVAEMDSTSVDWMLESALFLRDYMADKEEALRLLNVALGNAADQLGPDHPKTAKIYNEIGNTYRSLDDRANALRNYRKALDIRDKAYGGSHPDVAISYRNVGLIYAEAGMYGDAVEYYKKAVSILEDFPTERDSHIHPVYESLGNAYLYLKEFDKALDYHGKSLDLRRKIYGDSHPFVAASLNNMGTVWSARGEYGKASQYYSEALEMRKKIFGDRHPVVAGSFVNLANSLYALGDYEASLSAFNSAVEIFQTLYGGNDSRVKKIRENISLILEHL